MSFKIVPENGHWNLYINGEFYCSADSKVEAAKEYQNYIQEKCT